ncbi:MAG: hypothetical protein WAW17_09595 [Rhodococcus sp. (in: high G+C Gram-positive bacteria)]|uniref:hypothetical protein n=1 Tax=Rhodococcus sp. TaxID=1831 RepID=UPI003BAF7C2B
MPDQNGADRWAAEHTSGLIPTFPLTLGPTTVLVLASALATRVSWNHPFELTEGTQLPSWDVSHVLLSAEEHLTALATTEAAGDLAVHVAAAGEGVRVISVITDEDVRRERVFSAVFEIAHDMRQASRPHEFDRRLCLSDVPGTGHCWRINETTAWTNGHSVERSSAILPAWRAETDIDLADSPAYGFTGATPTLVRLLPSDTGLDVDARQSAVASFTRIGFEAAAVTAGGLMTGVPVERPVLEGVFLFGRPYAVVAYAKGGRSWDGLPIFSAWVAKAVEAE